MSDYLTWFLNASVSGDWPGIGLYGSSWLDGYGYGFKYEYGYGYIDGSGLGYGTAYGNQNSRGFGTGVEQK